DLDGKDRDGHGAHAHRARRASLMSFGYVIDFECAPKDALGGVRGAPTRLAEGASLEPDMNKDRCTACSLTTPGELGCIGIVTTPISVEGERWLCERLPGTLETISGEVLKQTVAAGFQGARGKELRKQGKLASRGTFERSWGSFFRRFTLTSDQLLEQMFCAGDIE